jgi:hypothetical protein
VFFVFFVVKILKESSMFPQQNAYRQYFDLSGFWDFRFDPEDQGQAAGWTDGFDGGQPIAVPASWNDQFLEDGARSVRDNLGPAWYQVIFALPWGFAGRQLSLRFGSVNYLADVWLNGVFLGYAHGFQKNLKVLGKCTGDRCRAARYPDRIARLIRTSVATRLMVCVQCLVRAAKPGRHRWQPPGDLTGDD